MAKHRYCEPVHRHFTVVFVGAAYCVGEGAVLNVSVPGCGVHSQNEYSQAPREGDGA